MSPVEFKNFQYPPAVMIFSKPMSHVARPDVPCRILEMAVPSCEIQASQPHTRQLAGSGLIESNHIWGGASG